jgi:hypothetical protein
VFISKYFSKVILILSIFSFAEFAQVNFTTYDTSNSILPTNKIGRLVKNVNGDILIGTGSGLFRRYTFKLFPAKDNGRDLS